LADTIVTRVKEALAYLPPERIFLNPDCGFGTFANRPMNTWDIAKQKLIAMAEAATCLRREYMSNTATSKQKA
jgi:5-methyltetrahydropteroyltriglutamate--homocysteine methyltransferase